MSAYKNSTGFLVSDHIQSLTPIFLTVQLILFSNYLLLNGLSICQASYSFYLRAPWTDVKGPCEYTRMLTLARMDESKVPGLAVPRVHTFPGIKIEEKFNEVKAISIGWYHGLWCVECVYTYIYLLGACMHTCSFGFRLALHTCMLCA